MSNVAEATGGSTDGDVTDNRSPDRNTGASQSQAPVLPDASAATAGTAGTASPSAASPQQRVDQAAANPETSEAKAASDDGRKQDGAARPTAPEKLPGDATPPGSDSAKQVPNSEAPGAPQTSPRDFQAEQGASRVPVSKPEASSSALVLAKPPSRPEVALSPLSPKRSGPEVTKALPDLRRLYVAWSFTSELNKLEASRSLSGTEQRRLDVTPSSLPEPDRLQGSPSLPATGQRRLDVTPSSSIELRKPGAAPPLPRTAPEERKASPAASVEKAPSTAADADAQAAGTPGAEKHGGAKAESANVLAVWRGVSHAASLGHLLEEVRSRPGTPAGSGPPAPGPPGPPGAPDPRRGWRRVDSSLYQADPELDYMRSVTSLLGGGEGAMSSLTDILAWSNASLDAAAGLLESDSSDFSDVLRVAAPRLRSVASILGFDAGGLRTRLVQIPGVTLRSLLSVTDVLEAAEQRTLAGIRWTLRYVLNNILPRLAQVAPSGC